jgi:hypothetical protein
VSFTEEEEEKPLAKPEKEIETKEDFFTVMQDRTNVLNLAILVITWASSAFGSYLINFELKYIPGSLYENVLMAACAECLAKPCGFALLSVFGLKKGFLLAYGIVCIGAVLLTMSTTTPELL